MSSKLTRRRFLGVAAMTPATLSFAAPALIRRGSIDRLNIAVVGTRNRGAANLNAIADQNIVALCDVDATHLAAASQQFPDAATYRDFRKMLEKQTDIDAVLCSTPDHLHAPISAMAMGMGKHIYCEKPLAHTVAETRALAQMAAETGLATQMGTQIHAGGNYRRVVELVRSGAIGPVRHVHVWCNKSWSNGRYKNTNPPAHLDWDLWQGPVPARPYSSGLHPSNWRRFWNYGTGTLGDMACHYVDLVHWALELRTPTRIRAAGPGRHEDGTPDSLVVHWDHPARGDRPAVRVTWYDGENRPSILLALQNAGGEPISWGDGQLFVGDEGMILSNYGSYRLLPESKFAGFTPPEPSIPDSIGHHREWIEACRTGSPTTCNFDYSGALTETVLLGNVAYRCGRTLDWDPKTMTAAGVPEADAFVRKAYRDGWFAG